MKKKEIIVISVMLLIYISVLIFIYPQLPEQLPMQFSVTGEVNWTLPKLYGILFMSGIWIFVLANYFFAKKESKTTLIITMGVIFVITIGFLTYIAYYR